MMFRTRKNTVIYFLFFGLNVFSQNLKSDSITIQKVIDRYISKKESQKLVVVSDKNDSELIKKYILEKNKVDKLNKEKIIRETESTIGKRYLKGDKTVIPSIIQALKKKNKEEIFEILKDLELDYDSKNKGVVLEPEIIEQLIKLMNDDYFENIIVQFLGYNRVYGSEEIFEKRLMSGLSKNNDRIFYWLASNYNNSKAVDFIYTSYFSNKINLEEEHWIFNGFEEYLKSNNNVINSKILEIAYDYLKKNPINKSSFEIKKGEYLFTGTPLNLKFFGILLEFGDTNANIILDNILKNLEGTVIYEEFKNKISLFKIKSYSKEDRKKIILKELENKDDFFEIIELVKNDSELYTDIEVNQLIFKNFQKFDFTDDSDFLRINDFLKDQEKEFVLNNIKNEFTNSNLKTHFQKKYLISKMSYVEISNFLLEHKIIDYPITNSLIENYKTKEYHYDNLNSIETCLDLAEVAYNFDTEVGTIPVDYNNLLNRFSGISKGKIKDIFSHVQYKIDRKKGKVYYHFLISYRDKCYIMKPEDQGDWYDIEMFEKLINQIVKDTNCKEEYISIETGGQDAYYIFGEKENINLMQKAFYPKYQNN